jgi:uncharacterized membrane protein YdjX (TVP38/TMEM64 family)
MHRNTVTENEAADAVPGPTAGPVQDPDDDAEVGKASRWGSILIWATFIIGIVSVLLISPESDEIQAFLTSLGPLAPLALFLSEIVQVVVIPIPGQPFEVAGGWMLGLLGGSVIASAGAFAGSLIAFHLARRFGRDWVHRHVGGGVQNRIARELQKGSRMEWIVFWLMMIPNFPRDPLCYVAGVSGMRSRGFVLIALLGRPVGLVPWVALGAEGVASGVAWQVGMIGIAAAIWFASRLVPAIAGSGAEPEAKG